MKTPWYSPATTMAVGSSSFDVREHVIAQYHPNNGNMHLLRLLPRGAVEATGIPLLYVPTDRPDAMIAGEDDDVWWQLAEADRHTFRVVYFHIAVMGARISLSSINLLSDQPLSSNWRRRRGDPTMRAVVSWLRWAAVRQAKSEKRQAKGLSRRVTWLEAYKAASERLRGTAAKGEASTMKTAYDSVQRILKARLG
jgi:hypothetical protein